MDKRSKLFHFCYYWLPVILYCLAIFIQSSFPSHESIPKVRHIDKALHFTAYALMGMLFLRGFKASRFQTRLKLIILSSILLTGLYGVGDELHQSFVPSRDGNAWDALADFLGGTAGTLAYQWLTGYFPVFEKI